MKFKIGNGLLPLNLLVVLLIVVTAFSPFDILRIILGLPFVIFFPGYALTVALFTKRGEITTIVRVILSVGISIVIVPLIGFILNYLWGIRLESILYSVASFIFITSIVAWLRWRHLPAQERFSVEYQPRMPSWGESVWDKILSIVMVMAIVGVLGMVCYVLAMPKAGERFNEFYILGSESQAANYPEQLVVGQEGNLIVGIINSQHETMSYRLEVMIDGIVNNCIEEILLEHDEKWEQEVNFIPEKAGDNQKLELLLYNNGEVEPCFDPLYFWIDVKEQ